MLAFQVPEASWQKHRGIEAIEELPQQRLRQLCEKLPANGGALVRAIEAELELFWLHPAGSTCMNSRTQLHNVSADLLDAVRAVLCLLLRQERANLHSGRATRFSFWQHYRARLTLLLFAISSKHFSHKPICG